MYIEEQTGDLRRQTLNDPWGWLVYFEERPLQGIPPNGLGPHLLLFSSEKKASAFIAGRLRYFGAEPLSVLAIDSPDTLKLLAALPSEDPRYAPPPCGVVFDFDYDSGSAVKVISPADMNRLLSSEIAWWLGLHPAQERGTIVKDWSPAPAPEPVKTPAPKPAQILAPAPEPVPTPASPALEPKPVEITVPPVAPPPPAPKKRSLTAIWITCGGLLVLGLLMLCLGGTWFGMSRGIIPALPFLYTPTATVPPTPTSTPTPTPVPWDVHIIDNFEANTYDWPVSVGNPGGDCGSDSRIIENHSLIWKINAKSSCYWWYYPDMPAVTDFDLSVDVQRFGAAGNDAGLVFRVVDENPQYFYIFAVDDINRTFSVTAFNGDWNTLIDWTYSAYIKPGAFNHLGVSARGSQISFSINDVVVETITDETSPFGKVGIVADVYNNGDSDTITYKNFEFNGLSK
jgi:hypothetical protein